MSNEKTYETISNLLSDFLREFEKELRNIYKPYKYAEDDVIPAWRASFYREKKAKEFRKACIDFFFDFLGTALLSVNDFCPSVKTFFDSHREALETILSNEFDDIVRRRSFFETGIVYAGVSPLSVPLALRFSWCPNSTKYIAFNQRIIVETLDRMKKSMEKVTKLSLQQ